MSKHLLRNLELLHQDLLGLAAAVGQSIQKALRALQDRDTDLAREVIAGDDLIDQQENQLEEECLKILALHQPVAKDLRHVVAAMMISTDLERMGDLAEGIAKRVLALSDLPGIETPSRLGLMAERTSTMVRQSLEAFIRQDASLARVVCREDDEVDCLNVEIIKELIAAMKARPEIVEVGLSLFSAVRQLERIADHATNIAEDIVYLVEGEIVRHHPEAYLPDHNPGAPD
jgi:phosphate transport system protein